MSQHEQSQVEGRKKPLLWLPTGTEQQVDVASRAGEQTGEKQGKENLDDQRNAAAGHFAAIVA